VALEVEVADWGWSKRNFGSGQEKKWWDSNSKSRFKSSNINPLRREDEDWDDFYSVNQSELWSYLWKLNV
jgi:hypothetical protein